MHVSQELQTKRLDASVLKMLFLTDLEYGFANPL